MISRRLFLFLLLIVLIILLYYLPYYFSSLPTLSIVVNPPSSSIHNHHEVKGASTVPCNCSRPILPVAPSPCPTVLSTVIRTDDDDENDDYNTKDSSSPSSTTSSSSISTSFLSLTEELDTRIDGLIEFFLRNRTLSNLLAEQYTDKSKGNDERYHYLTRTLDRLSFLTDQLRTTIEILKKNITHHEELQIIDNDMDSIIYPDPSTIQCHLQQDSSDLCEYENICIDIPSDQVSFNKFLPWYLIESYTISSDTTESDLNKQHPPPSSLSPFDVYSADFGSNTNAKMENRITDTVHRWTKTKQKYRHARRQEGKHGKSLYHIVKETSEERLSWDFVDVLSPHPGNQPRAVPFGSYYHPVVITAEDSIPQMVGGKFPGFVTWIDNLYTVYSLLHSQLWGFSQGVVFPIFGSVFANESLDLHLPPIDNLYIAPDRFRSTEHLNTAWLHKQPYFGYKGDRWVMGFLNDTLEFFNNGNPPFSGFDSLSNTSDIKYTDLPEKMNGRYPFQTYIQEYIKPIVYEACYDYDSKLAPFTQEEYFGGIAGKKLDVTKSLNRIAVCVMRYAESLNPFNHTIFFRNTSLPKFSYQTLLMENNQPGTRIMYSPRDIPPHPLIMGLLSVFEELAIPIIQSTETIPLTGNILQKKIHDTEGYQLLYEHMLRYIPHRVCAKRAVLLGNRDTLVGGNAEATFIRKFAIAKGTTPRLDRAYVFPPPKVLILDRGAKPSGADFYGRWFANREEMEEIIQKYNVTYRVLTDEELNRLSFNEQMKIFGQYGLLIIAHGAGECTSAFMPPRSAVIEIYPFGTWCPVFLRMHTASGNHHFSIHSELKGNNLDYSYVLGPKGARGSPEHLESADKIAKRCESLGHVGASLTPDCWHENRMSNVVIPLVEFEHTFLLALRAIGVQRFPINSPISLLQGAPNGTYFTDSPLSQLDPNYYRRRRWSVCPTANSSGSSSSSSSTGDGNRTNIP